MVDFEPGNDDEAASVWKRRLPAERRRCPRPLRGQGIEIVEIGDPRQDGDRDLQRLPPPRVSLSRTTESSAGSRPATFQPGHDAEARPAGKLADRCDAVVEERTSPRKLVDEVAR